jgi:hypothetical protein
VSCACVYLWEALSTCRTYMHLCELLASRSFLSSFLWPLFYLAGFPRAKLLSRRFADMTNTKPWPQVPVGNKDHTSAAVVIIGAGISGTPTDYYRTLRQLGFWLGNACGLLSGRT